MSRSRHGRPFEPYPVPLSREDAKRHQQLRNVATSSPASKIAARIEAAENAPLVNIDLAGRVINTHAPSGFTDVLPNDVITQFVKAGDTRYNHDDGLGVTRKIAAFKSQSRGAVFVLTDVLFYAVGPGSGLNAAPIELEPAAVAGLLRFEIKFAGRVPLTMTTAVQSPYSTPTQTLGVGGDNELGGWSFLERQFGTLRAASFALYARPQEEVQFTYTIEDIPRFPLIKVGVHYHGFLIPETFFNEIWELK